VSVAAAVGQIVARMAHPASERATHAWLQRRSALGEFSDFDYERLSLTRLYRVADELWGEHERVERVLHARLSSVFRFSDTVALYDLTNTYFEGLAADNPQARRGHSKEKRSDAPLITLGLVLDGAGFVRRSQVFAGNVRESATLQGMLDGLDAPEGSRVVCDRGIVSEDNLTWLREHGYRYLVMSRERRDLEAGATLATTNGEDIHWQRVLDDDDGEVRLLCHSPQRAKKEEAMVALQRARFEKRMAALAQGLAKPYGVKRLERVHQRIGRLKEAYASVAQHYHIEVEAQGDVATAIRYIYTPTQGSKAALPGHYVLRSNDTSIEGEALWRLYVQLTELEAVFRSLKSERGLRPIHHPLDHRCCAHLWISVLAYQCVQFLRRRLKEAGIDAGWATVREALSGQRRLTASFRTAEGDATLHVRKTSTPEAEAAAIYAALGLDPRPGGVKKRRFHLGCDL
jgi:transposase